MTKVRAKNPQSVGEVVAVLRGGYALLAYLTNSGPRLGVAIVMFTTHVISRLLSLVCALLLRNPKQ